MIIDLEKIKSLAELNEDEIRKEYIETDGFGEMVLKGKPCIFLRNRKCTIYHSRPFECRSYPHLHKKDFTFMLFGVLDNYSVCPCLNEQINLQHN
jgi:Fe-S-cluster containining protein